jgi:NAD(P)-dependent dehydrogenase (short-subunit alcohol dehydrogenase family)
MVDEGVKAFGAIHYAVNNAGITSKPRVRTHELETASWDLVQQVNLRGLWLCERAELRQMMKQEPELKMRCEFIISIRCCVVILTIRSYRTGAQPQRGSIVNVSSIFAVISHPTVGAVGLPGSCVMSSIF